MATAYPSLTLAIAHGERLAEAQLRQTGRLAPLIQFDGTGGTATVRLDLVSPSGRTRTLKKARLMATAVNAQVCVVVLGTQLLGAGEPADVVATFARDRTTSRAALARIERAPDGGIVRLTGIATPLTHLSTAEIACGLLRLLPMAAPTEGEQAEAWQNLASMGVMPLGCRPVLH